MRNIPMSIEEFREEFSRLFDQKSEEFFIKVFGTGSEKRKDTDGEWMTMNEATSYFRVSRVTLNNWIKKDKIISIKKGNHRFFNREYAERFRAVNFVYREKLPKTTSKYL